MVNDYECGSIAQRIINGTDKLPMPDRKRYVYFVHEDIHGFVGAYGNKEKATQVVKEIAFNEYYLEPNTPLDFADEECWGWEATAWWVIEEVIE